LSAGERYVREKHKSKGTKGGARNLNQYATDEICRLSNSWYGFVRPSDTSVRTEGHRFAVPHCNIFRVISCQTLILFTTYAVTEYELKALCGKVLRILD